MFRVSIGSSLWGCAYSFSHKRRIVAFRKAQAAVNQSRTPRSGQAIPNGIGLWLTRIMESTHARQVAAHDTRRWLPPMYLEIERLQESLS